MTLTDVFIFAFFAYALPFSLFTVLAWLRKGSAALHWDRQTIKSGVCNVGMGLFNLMIAPAVYMAIIACQAVYESLSIPHIPASVWAALPVWLVALIFFIARDFADYWNHRLLHTSGLWPIHAVHHSDPDMNHTTALRIHILEPVVMGVSYIPLLSWLGLPADIGAGLALFTVLYNKFVHLDADIHFGPLTKLLATPRFHRWHHADDPSVYNTNFANVFSAWDVLFGTYHCPGPYKGRLGFEDSPNHNFPRLVTLPFVLVWQSARARRDAALKTAIPE